MRLSKSKIVFLITGLSIITISVIALFIFKLTANKAGDLEVIGTGALPWMLGGVVIDLGNPGSQDDKSIESPTVVKLADNSYVMWYRGQSYADKIGRIMRATSSDGINWTKTGVCMVPSTDYEGDKIDPMTVIYENDVYKMWYGAEAYGGCACYATSSDGINWDRYEGNPVLRKTSNAWDNEGAGGQHTVIKINNKYCMYYKGYGNQSPGWTFYGMAESSDGIHWIKKGKILSPDPSVGDTVIFRNLSAFKIDDTYCIMFTMADYLNLYLASSKDGKNWVKNGLIFIHGQTPGGYDEKWSTSPSIIVETDRIRMWYEGGDPYGHVRILYAEMAKKQFLEAFKRVIKSHK